MKPLPSNLLVGFLFAVVAASLAFAWVVRREEGGAGRGRVRVLQASHPLPISHPVHFAMLRFAERVNELSGGTLRVEVFASAQLGNDAKVIEQMQRGTVAFSLTSTATLGNFTPLFRIFSLPYLFRDEEHYWKVLEGPPGREILGGLARGEDGRASGLTGLTFFDGGSRSFYTKRPIHTPADLQGLKIRVIADPVCMDAVAAMGASPTPVPWGELYTALQQGMIDGAENNLPSLLTARHNEVCGFHCASEHLRLPDVLVASTAVWNSLPATGQDWLKQAASEAQELQRELWHTATAQARVKLEAGGMVFFEPDLAPFRAAARSAFEKHATGGLGELARRIQAEGAP